MLRMRHWGFEILNILCGFIYNIMISGIIFFFFGLIPLSFIIVFSGLDLVIAFIQAQVFAGFVIWIYKGWIRSSLINIYSAMKSPVYLYKLINKLIFKLCIIGPPKPHAFVSAPLRSSFSLMGSFDESKPRAVKGKGVYIITKDGRVILDASSGAMVSCIGHGNKRVITAITKQNKTGITYLSSSWGSEVVDNLCEALIRGTNNKMSRVYLLNSGSEATEAAIKLAFSYHCENNEPKRINIIAREGSYHGATLIALSVSGYPLRKNFYEGILKLDNIHYVSPCYPYRERIIGESDEAFVARKKAELEAKILELGPDTVMAFILEPVVGVALGGVPSVPGYLKAIQETCVKYGVLLIFDEILCGMGRTGTLHAWQAENVIPDIQTNGKGLGGGFVPISAVLASEMVVNVINKGSGEFVHGQTYEGMPSTVAGALEVQRVILDNNLLDNVAKQGLYLEKRLKAVLSDHPNVGEIRGRALLWCIEFVEDKKGKKSFNPNLEIAKRIVDLAFSPRFNLAVYYGGPAGYYYHIDRVMIAPPFIIKKKEVDHIVEVLYKVINMVFSEVSTKRM